MRLVQESGKALGVATLCAALAVPRATFYRQQKPVAPRGPRRKPPRTLSDDERAKVLAALNEPRFEVLSPDEVYATLLDEGSYLCSRRTMYRVLVENDEVPPIRPLLSLAAGRRYAVGRKNRGIQRERWSTSRHGSAPSG